MLIESIGSTLSNLAEALVRNRMQWQAIQLLTGYPIIGALVGLIALGLAFLVCRAPTPYELITALSIIAIALSALDFIGRTFVEPAGELVNKGFTSVFGIPCISHRDRLRVDSALES